jgi:hypothetical protein
MRATRLDPGRRAITGNQPIKKGHPMTQPIIHDKPERGTVDYYRSRLSLAVDTNDLHARALGLISGAFYDVDASSSARLQRIDNVLTVTTEVTAALLGRPLDMPEGMSYSRQDDDPQVIRPHSPRLPLHTGSVVDGGELVDETPAEPTLSAAIRFSEARREALRSLRVAGRPLAELDAATLDLLHGQALDDEAERAQRADVRPGEEGRITNPRLARFLAEKEERQRIARHFLGLEESAKHYPAEDERCPDCGESLREIERGTLGHIPGEACAPASGLTPAADQSRGPLAGTTPVVTYFSFGYGQTDPGTGQKLLDHYVTVVAPTYEECREAMFASRFGRKWSFDYLAGRPKTTEAVSRWTEHEVIVAPGTDPVLAEAALKAASDLLADEPVSESH